MGLSVLVENRGGDELEQLIVDITRTDGTHEQTHVPFGTKWEFRIAAGDTADFSVRGPDAKARIAILQKQIDDLKGEASSQDAAA